MRIEREEGKRGTETKWNPHTDGQRMQKTVDNKRMKIYFVWVFYYDLSPIPSVQRSMWLLFLQKYTDIWITDPPTVMTILSIHDST